MNINGYTITANANLRDADLYGADLRGANLRNADLRNADLRSANLRRANLLGANLCAANLSDANLRSADLHGADLHGADLCDAHLRNANLGSADLCDAYLRDANLRDANLRDADLRGADLSGTLGLLTAADYLHKHFEFDIAGLIAYKSFPSIYVAPDHWDIAPNRVICETVNPLPTIDCGCGVNIATLKWCKANCSTRIWRCRVAWKDLADVVVPYNTDGKIRAARVLILEAFNGSS